MHSKCPGNTRYTQNRPHTLHAPQLPRSRGTKFLTKQVERLQLTSLAVIDIHGAAKPRAGVYVHLQIK
jgi:hypothetical protein